jgi:hypothetical protein
MPIEFSIDRESGYVHTVMRGDLSPADVIEYASQLRSHPDFAPSLPRLVDLRSFDTPGLNPTTCARSCSAAGSARSGPDGARSWYRRPSCSG